MNNSILQYIISKLEQRKADNNFRALKVSDSSIDFTSNDYLGLAEDKQLRVEVLREMELLPTGSTGSRLLSGNSEYIQRLEKMLAEYHQAENALLFNSGFDANYGLLSTLPYKGDVIIYDELVHASIHDGIRHSKADSLLFAHNDLSDLDAKLREVFERTETKLKYVVVESIYSMDGDFAPLKELAALCRKYDAGLIVDEAHATGIFGSKGEGRVSKLKLEKECIARVHTFGKAIGGNGAVILCSNELKAFLVNYCRPFIYSTALPYYNLAHIRCAYHYLPTDDAVKRRESLFYLIQLFRKTINQNNFCFTLLHSETPIQSIVVKGNDKVKLFAAAIQKAGFDVRPILYPTVPKGSERIRICLHSFNTEAEVCKLAETINAL
ncbi:MAG: 8-amino-7-oxononanoate synthase [Chitinophagales bacterium]|nr:8-amino-7-oxononanoate synthase [Chitinophagales bacterium]